MVLILVESLKQAHKKKKKNLSLPLAPMIKPGIIEINLGYIKCVRSLITPLRMINPQLEENLVRNFPHTIHSDTKRFIFLKTLNMTQSIQINQLAVMRSPRKHFWCLLDVPRAHRLPTESHRFSHFVLWRKLLTYNYFKTAVINYFKGRVYVRSTRNKIT